MGGGERRKLRCLPSYMGAVRIEHIGYASHRLATGSLALHASYAYVKYYILDD